MIEKIAQAKACGYIKDFATGPPREVQKNPEVIAAYLGTDWQT